MRIGIIGAGFTGLAAAYYLQKKGHEIIVFEKDQLPGGLAIGYQENGWSWTLEQHYHHWFTNDRYILNLAKELNYEIIIKRPHTNWFVDGVIYEFDSIPAALRFPKLSMIERIRHLATLGFFRFNPWWKPLEKLNATTFLPKMMGKNAYQTLYAPLFYNKFGEYAHDVSLAWFWARIKKRTQSLAYPKGGFLRFAQTLSRNIVQHGGIIYYNSEIVHISGGEMPEVSILQQNKLQTFTFDRVIVTTPSILFRKIAPELPIEYTKHLDKLRGIGATNLILRLNKPFFTNDTYWLSIADPNSPIMAIVEHTNFMNKSRYNNEHLVYLGNYLATNHPNYQKNHHQLLKLYDPFLRKINPDYQKHLIDYKVFKTPFAQPIIPKNYSRLIPSMKTPLRHVFLANIEQVYPWDRGTNYAVELGKRVAEYVAL